MFISDPNVHIIWMDSVHARLKALRDIEEGLFIVHDLQV